MSENDEDILNSETENYEKFCHSQPLAFCSNCEPMCTIQTNCLEHNMCYTNTPFDTIYWTPRIDTCCAMCNVYCDITRWHPVFANNTPKTTSKSTTSTTFKILTPNLPFDDPIRSESNLLTYILASCAAVILLGLILLIIVFRKKLERRIESFKSKYATTKTQPATSAGDRDEDITDVAITELWERIKNDDNYVSNHSRPVAFNRAPLASVLLPNSTDL